MVTFADGVTPLQELHSHINGYCGEHEDLNACLKRVRDLVEELLPLKPPPQRMIPKYVTMATSRLRAPSTKYNFASANEVIVKAADLAALLRSADKHIPGFAEHAKRGVELKEE